MQEKSGNIILGLAGPGDRFTLRYGWLRFRLSIKPLTVKQLIEISKEVSKVRHVDDSKDWFASLMSGVSDTKYIAKVIAIATGTRHRRLVAKAIMGLPLADIKRAFDIVLKQSDPTPFFFFITLASGRMNLLKATEQPSAETVSSGE